MLPDSCSSYSESSSDSEAWYAKLGFRGNDGPWTINWQFQWISYARSSGKWHPVCSYSSSGARAITFYNFQDGDGGHLAFRGQDDPQTLQLTFQWICNARNSGKWHLVCLCSSSGARAITSYVFQDGVGGHFEYCAVAEVPVTIQRYIEANFPFKWFLKSNPSRKKGSKKWSRIPKIWPYYYCKGLADIPETVLLWAGLPGNATSLS